MKFSVCGSALVFVLATGSALAQDVPAAGDAAKPADTGQRIFGLTRVQVSAAMACNAEAVFGLGAHFLYASGQPIEETLPLALANTGTHQDPGEIEQRLRSVYAAAPVSAAAWSKPQFKACLTRHAVPLDNDRAGDCYLATFFLSTMLVTERKKALDDPKAFIAPIAAQVQDPAIGRLLPKLAATSAAQVPGDPMKDNMRDLRGFLTCAAPGEAPVSQN